VTRALAIASKTTTKKKTAKKAARKKAARKMAASAPMPRRENIPGIAVGLPDLSDWREAARALRVRPFYSGPDSVPFSRLRATQMLDSARGHKSFNDFYLE
jgi:hypothetical protein